MTIWRMRIAFWMTKATNTHSACVMFLSSPLQQWLHATVSVLRHMYSARLVPCYRRPSAAFRRSAQLQCCKDPRVKIRKLKFLQSHFNWNWLHTTCFGNVYFPCSGWNSSPSTSLNFTHFFFYNTRDFRLPPRCKWGLSSSGMLRSYLVM